MKYLKKFENINSINIGDYVICNERFSPDDEEVVFKEVLKITSTTIGRYIKKDGSHLLIQYENIPRYMTEYFSVYNIKNCRRMSPEEIKYFSSSKEKMQSILDNILIGIDSIKFNL